MNKEDLIDAMADVIGTTAAEKATSAVVEFVAQWLLARGGPAPGGDFKAIMKQTADGWRKDMAP